LIIKEISLARALALTVAGASGVGWGTVVLGGLPEGNLLILGAVANMRFSGPTSGSLDDDWVGDFGIGSTPASDGTISAGDVDIIDSTAIGAATAEVSPVTRGTGVTTKVLDNTAGTLELNMNLLIDDADISADGIEMTVDGELYLSFVVLGDD
jgi:hypothetical protein